jgi:peptidoglycan hydrolase CwlO-like protein
MVKRILIAAVLLFIAVSVGCTSEVAKLTETLHANHDKALEILKDNVDADDKAVAALVKLEEDTREERTRLRRAWEAAMAELEKDEQDAIRSELTKRWTDYSSQFGTLVKRYETQTQPRLKQLIGMIAR